MSGALDMALDDVISQNRKQRPSNNNNSRGGRRGTFNGGVNKSRSSFNGRSSLPYNRPPRNNVVKPAGTNSLVVANLHFNVTEKDLYDLFGQIGPLNRAFLHISPNGQSAGIADVVFKSANDAERARNTYNNVELDGRPMRITTAGSSGPQVNDRISAPRRDNFRGSFRGGDRRSGDRRAPRGGHNRREARPKPTEQDLDADMDSYMGTA